MTVVWFLRTRATRLHFSVFHTYKFDLNNMNATNLTNVGDGSGNLTSPGLSIHHFIKDASSSCLSGILLCFLIGLPLVDDA